LADDGSGGTTWHEEKIIIGVFARRAAWSKIAHEGQRFGLAEVRLALVVYSIVVIEVLFGCKGVLSKARECLPGPFFGGFCGFAIREVGLRAVAEGFVAEGFVAMGFVAMGGNCLGGSGGRGILLGRFRFLASRGEFLASFSSGFAFASDFLDGLIKALDFVV
jgi:hypothetical protein